MPAASSKVETGSGILVRTKTEACSLGPRTGGGRGVKCTGTKVMKVPIWDLTPEGYLVQTGESLSQLLLQLHTGQEAEGVSGHAKNKRRRSRGGEGLAAGSEHSGSEKSNPFKCN